jgi:hypothetical protein
MAPDAISNAIGYAKFYSRSHNAVIRVYDEAGTVIEARDFAKVLPPPVFRCERRYKTGALSNRAS